MCWFSQRVGPCAFVICGGGACSEGLACVMG